MCIAYKQMIAAALLSRKTLYEIKHNMLKSMHIIMTSIGTYYWQQLLQLKFIDY